MKRVAILSDTHGLLREEVREELKKADIILHAGDINTQAIVDEMKSYAPLYIVRGNNDKEWAASIPESIRVTIEGVRFFMVHNKKHIPKDLSEVDVIVYGHSHKYEEKEEEGVFMLNPGSCGKRRFDLEITMAVMTIEDGKFDIEKLLINH
ncbi:MAG: metallophosphoesterase family protein [bacterium]|nr:metallophosphoesterase family protein [bacterium]